jgi:hypothetical protein
MIDRDFKREGEREQDIERRELTREKQQKSEEREREQ